MKTNTPQNPLRNFYSEFYDKVASLGGDDNGIPLTVKTPVFQTAKVNPLFSVSAIEAVLPKSAAYRLTKALEPLIQKSSIEEKEEMTAELLFLFGMIAQIEGQLASASRFGLSFAVYAWRQGVERTITSLLMGKHAPLSFQLLKAHLAEAARLLGKLYLSLCTVRSLFNSKRLQGNAPFDTFDEALSDRAIARQSYKSEWARLAKAGGPQIRKWEKMGELTSTGKFTPQKPSSIPNHETANFNDPSDVLPGEVFNATYPVNEVKVAPPGTEDKPDSSGFRNPLSWDAGSLWESNLNGSLPWRKPS